jgi:hypothetical protein
MDEQTLIYDVPLHSQILPCLTVPGKVTLFIQRTKLKKIIMHALRQYRNDMAIGGDAI